ncbi:hypothetical protein MIDIC_110120 [Alphaproteobacteria bacterium]
MKKLKFLYKKMPKSCSWWHNTNYYLEDNIAYYFQVLSQRLFRDNGKILKVVLLLLLTHIMLILVIVVFMFLV